MITSIINKKKYGCNKLFYRINHGNELFRWTGTLYELLMYHNVLMELHEAKQKIDKYEKAI